VYCRVLAAFVCSLEGSRDRTSQSVTMPCCRKVRYLGRKSRHGHPETLFYFSVLQVAKPSSTYTSVIFPRRLVAFSLLAFCILFCFPHSLQISPQNSPHAVTRFAATTPGSDSSLICCSFPLYLCQNAFHQSATALHIHLRFRHCSVRHSLDWLFPRHRAP
jgi:hypothetical protein